MYVHAVMDWSRESNRQQCQQATPTGPAPHCTTLCHYVPHCATLCHTAPHCTTLYHTVSLCTTMYHTVSHSVVHTVPNCATLYHNLSSFLFNFSLSTIFIFLCLHYYSSHGGWVQTLLQRSKFDGNLVLSSLLHLNASEVNWIALK